MFLVISKWLQITPLCLPAGGVYDGESILSDRLRGEETEWQNNFPAVGGDAGGG
jgi:hypothetical protein